MHEGFSLWYGVKALLWPTSSVMHVVFHKKPPDEIKVNEFQKLTLTRKEYLELVQYICSYFDFEEDVSLPILGDGLYGISNFYPANGKYHVFKTSNTWVAKGLKRIGRKTALLPLTAGAVMQHLE